MKRDVEVTWESTGEPVAEFEPRVLAQFGALIGCFGSMRIVEYWNPEDGHGWCVLESGRTDAMGAVSWSAARAKMATCYWLLVAALKAITEAVAPSGEGKIPERQEGGAR
jgi:hypothetical protein